MNQPLRPTADQIKKDEHTQKIFGDRLKLEPEYRPELERLLESTRNDTAAYAYCAFALAYSLDHYKPYNHQRAIQLLDDALKQYPEWPEALFNKAVAEIHVGSFDAAIGNLDIARRRYLLEGKLPNSPAGSYQFELTIAKIHMFKAEALVGRDQPGDRGLARIELSNSETALYSALDKASSPTERARVSFWIKQISGRLEQTDLPAKSFFFSRATSSSNETQATEQIRYPGSFLIGILLTPLLLWWLVHLANSAKPVSAPTAAETTKTATATSDPDAGHPTSPPSINCQPEPEPSELNPLEPATGGGASPAGKS